MTEKRFIEFATQNTDNGEINNGFNDIKTGEWYYTKDSENAKKICEALNNLHEKNQELHKTIEELDNCQKGQSHRINDLYLENKQLKDLITHLGYTIKYDGYRHISLELI